MSGKGILANDGNDYIPVSGNCFKKYEAVGGGGNYNLSLDAMKAQENNDNLTDTALCSQPMNALTNATTTSLVKPSLW